MNLMASLYPRSIDSVLEDAGLVRRLVEQNEPYYPVQRYFRNDGQHMIIAPNFRGDWAYDKPLIEGVEPILYHEGFIEAARAMYDTEVVRPQQVYCNLTWQLPFPQGPGHTDIPAFRGVDRTRYPTTLLSLMGQSGLFEPWRIHIVTAVAWFYRGSDGGLDYWPDGPDAPKQVHEGKIFNTAIVGDNDFMFHRVRPVGRREDGLPGPMTLDTRLARKGGENWQLIEGDTVLGEPKYDDLRISISWKANVGSEDGEELDIDQAFEIFRADGLDVPADPLNDPDFFRALTETYSWRSPDA
jgi:hypothetical protein